MSAHTPGPWTLNKANREPMVGIDVKDGGQLLPIVNVVAGRTIAEANRNARLIAAAPELLAACRGALSANTPESRDQAFALCAAAIAKAEAA